MRILLVMTYRPEFRAPWTGHAHVTALHLNRLGRRHCRAMIESVASCKPLPSSVMEQIIAKTDGVPLFVEELTKTVLESGLLEERNHAWELTGSLQEFAIPATLRDSLVARLDRLPSVKEVAQVAAAIGREFPYKLLTSSVADVRERLEKCAKQACWRGACFCARRTTRRKLCLQARACAGSRVRDTAQEQAATATWPNRQGTGR